MKTLIIGTTSINRPELHSDNIPEWYEWINKLSGEEYNIKWFINIDIIENLNFTYEETEENYRRIIKDIDITFLRNEEGKGNFLKACQRVSQNIETYVNYYKLNKEDVIIFWLEDDWKLNVNVQIPLDELIKKYLFGYTHINLSFIKNNYIHALAPGIHNYKLWEQLHLEAWKRQQSHIDPEHCVGVYYKWKFNKNKKNPYKKINNITLITKYKKFDETILNQSYLNYINSYLVLHEDYKFKNKDLEILIKSHNSYIKYIENKNNIKNTHSFVRISCGLCNDYGRVFMEKYNLKKNIQKTDADNFYESK